jgi:hypothetical protein
VELTGFEPVTPSLRTRCSARLSYSPMRGEPNCIGRCDSGQIRPIAGRAEHFRLPVDGPGLAEEVSLAKLDAQVEDVTALGVGLDGLGNDHDPKGRLP